MEALLRRRILGRILVQHYHNLRHIIQFGHHRHVLHGPAPLLIRQHVQQPAEPQHRQQRMHMRFARKVQSRPHMPTGTRHTVAVARIQSVHTLVAHLFDVALQIGLHLLQQRRTNPLADGQLLLNGQPVFLRYHNVGQIPGVDVQLLGLLVLQRMLVVLQIVLDAIVDIRDL